MHARRLAVLAVAAAIAAALPTLAAVAAGQAPEPGADWMPPRTPDGQPDLQGIWTMATFTPLERPAHLAGRESFTEEEAAALLEDLTADGADPLALTALSEPTAEQRRQRLRQSKNSVHYDNVIWMSERQPKGLTTLRTSLIVDPPDGRIPPLTPAARTRQAARVETSAFLWDFAPPKADSYETRSLQERCLVWRHEGPPFLPAAYLDRIQIFQSPGYVAILHELSNNQARLIPLDGRPHLPPNIRQWPGDSRGRWEGDTLVVDTTNFTHKTHFRGSGEALHAVERFTRTAAETIRYEFTVEDPTSWTRPWSVEIPMKRADGPIFEYACSEGNYGLRNILSSARNLEAAARDVPGNE